MFQILFIPLHQQKKENFFLVHNVWWSCVVRRDPIFFICVSKVQKVIILYHILETFITFAAKMKDLQHKRTFAAWILTLVFVPMLLLSGFHHHERRVENHIACSACAHHVHHDGHLTQQASSIDHCILCQLLSTPYIIYSTTSVCVCLSLLLLLTYGNRSSLVAAFHGTKSCRAPPFYLS